MKISSIIPLFAALAAVKAQIAPGLYTIRSLATDERGFWDVRPATEGRYRLTIRQNPIGGFDNRLFAFLTEDPRINQEWFITPVVGYGANNYIVETAHKARGWVAPDAFNPDRQLGLRPLIVGASIPPFYPPTEVFTFTPLFS
ncbi:hypothetical protein VE04_09722 [Pseudogymnoascus sp. 24MN13]|nr:hypothetical protein VE04_09722 [Pseudogymnoascus sp. 24MN13]